MGLFERLNRAPKEDITEAPPENGVRRFFFLLKTHFWKIITLNMLFVAFSLPVVTLPAALCGMNRVCVKLVREGNCFLWHDFWKEFKSEIIKSLPIGLLYLLELAAAYYSLSLSVSNGGVYGVIFGAVGILLLLVVTVGGGYVFAMLAMVQLTNRQILRNAAALAGLEMKKSLAILGLSILFAAIGLLLYPYSTLIMPFFYFSVHALAVITVANGAIQKHIVAPFEAAQAEEAGAAADAAAAFGACAAAANAAAANAAAANAAAEAAAAREGPGEGE